MAEQRPTDTTESLPAPVEQKQAENFYQVLRKSLAAHQDGQEILTAFETDPELNGVALADYLRRHLPEDKELAAQLAAALGDGGQFNTIVAGGHVEQLVNIARLGVLNLTVSRYFYFFRDLKQLALFLVTILLVAGGIAGAWWWFSQPAKMDGEFNIAVAQFGEESERGSRPSRTANRISNALFSFLDGEFKAAAFDLDVQVSHKNMPLVLEDLDAQKLADKVNAHVVLYGTVFVRGETAEFTPRFYIAKRSQETVELTGQYKLGLPIPFSLDQLGFQDDINTLLRTRAATLIAFTQGLVHLTREELPLAEASFLLALTEADKHPPFEGKEVLYLYLAMVNRLQGRLEEASAYLDQAQALNPEYARSYIGRGNIHYERYRAAGNVADLEKARLEYERALAATDRPAAALVTDKVNVTLGNVYLIQAQISGNDPALFAQATDLYQQVIDHFRADDDNRLQEMAAIAYFGLGVAHERQNQPEEAIAFYTKSVELTRKEEQKAQAQAQITLLTSAEQSSQAEAVPPLGQEPIAPPGVEATEAAPAPAATNTTSAPLPTSTSTVAATPESTPEAVANPVGQAPELSEAPPATATVDPTQPAPSNQAACVPFQPAGWVRYRVQAGNTLSGLAARGGTSVRRLKDVNCHPSDIIRIGEFLYVPAGVVQARPAPTATELDDSKMAIAPEDDSSRVIVPPSHPAASAPNAEATVVVPDAPAAEAATVIVPPLVSASPTVVVPDAPFAEEATVIVPVAPLPLSPTDTPTVIVPEAPLASPEPTQTPTPIVPDPAAALPQVHTFTPTPTVTRTATAIATATATATATTAGAATRCVVRAPAGWVRYTVQVGDRLSLLAARGGTTIGRLQEVNCLPSDMIRVGQVLWVPPAGLSATATPRPSPTGTATPLPTSTTSATRTATPVPTETDTAIAPPPANR